MSRFVLAGLIPLLLAVGACQQETAPPAGPATPAQFQAIRAEMQRADRNASVGQVTAVLPENHLVSVGNIPTANFVVGDPISFLDSRQDVVAMGTVVGVESTRLDVQYQASDPGGRAPEVGDVAVKAIP